MLSKVFTRALKPAFNQVFKSKQVTNTFFRAMASSEVARIDKGKQKLTKALTREIKFEEENYTNDESVQVIPLCICSDDSNLFSVEIPRRQQLHFERHR